MPFPLPSPRGWALILLVVWLYHSILYRLAIQYSDPNFSHGFFVPAFALFVLWQNRARVKATPLAPSWLGFPIIAFALVMLVLGVLGVELFTSRMSLILLIGGLIILFRGWPLFRAVLFPWAFLSLGIPLPNLILQRVTFPLQILASKLSTSLLELVGIPVLREGNVIHLAAKSLEVVEACAGIRSMLSLLTLAIMYGYLMEQRNWVRVLLACSAVPIAVCANAFRIFGTGVLVQYWDPDKAEGFYHLFQGWLIFVVSLILLFTFHRIVNLIWKPKPHSGSKSLAAPLTPVFYEIAPAPTGNVTLRFAAPAVLMLATAIGLMAHSQNEVFPPRQSLSTLPAEINGFTSRDEVLDAETLEVLGPGEFLDRYYVDPQQLHPWINLFIAYFPTQKMGDTIHSPNHCLPGSGWVPSQRQVVRIPDAGGESFPANRYIVTKGAERQLVLYWFQAHGREVAGDYESKYYLISDSIRLHRSDGSLVRFMTPMLDGESSSEAQVRVMKVASQVIPLLDNYIPR
jgi:exosortase D (VPLPA-CTERM-specific)